MFALCDYHAVTQIRPDSAECARLNQVMPPTMQPRRREVPRRGATRAAKTCMMSPLWPLCSNPLVNTHYTAYAGASNISIHVRKENRPCCLFVPLFPASTPPGLASHADPGETLMLHVLPHSTMNQAAWCLPAGLPVVVCTYMCAS